MPSPARPRDGWPGSGARALLIGALLLAGALPGRAELVVFSSGHVLRVESFRIDGDQARVELSSGSVRFPASLVERVVANEVELTADEKRMSALDLGLGTTAGTRAPPGTEAEEFFFEPAPPAGSDPAEPDPARSISGRVLDEAGEPVDGVEVRARAISLFQGAGVLGGNLPEAKTQSDRDGRYGFEQLAAGEYRLHSLATDRYTSARTRARTGTEDADLVLNEKRDVAVHGTVTDPQGEPLPEVRVTQVDRPAAAVTDYDGRYDLELAAGGRDQTHSLSFELAGYGGRTLSLAGDQVRGRSEIRLDARLEPLESLAAVEGDVRNPAEAPVVGETVFLVGGEHHRQTATDGSGRFLISGVDAHRTYKLWISPRGPYRKYQQEVQVGAEGVKLSVVLEPERFESASLAGRMVDAAGDPVPHFSLWLRSSGSAARQPLLVTGDGSGFFTVPEAPLGRLSFSTVSEPRLTVGGLDLSPDGAEGVQLVLDAGGHEIRGRVLDSYGNPVAAPRLTLEWSHQGGGLHSLSQRRGVGDAAGFFSFTGVGPGPHLVRITAPGFGSKQHQAEPGRDLVVQLGGNGEAGGAGGR